VRSVALQAATGELPRNPGVLLLESTVVTPSGSRVKRALGAISRTLAEGILAISAECERSRPVSAFLYGLRGWAGDGADWGEVAEIIYADSGRIHLNIPRELARRASAAASGSPRARCGGANWRD
jgi:hypothetical protein